MNSKSVGDISEAKVLAALVAQNKTVLRPFGDNQRYDFAVEEDGHFDRIQVKTGRLRNGSVVFSTHSSTTKKGKRIETGYSGQVEAFGVYCPEIDAVFLVPISVCGHTKVELRVGQTKRAIKTAKYATHYKL